MNNIFNATEEIANSATYTNIRMFKANLFTSEVEEDDLVGGGWGGWYSPDDPNYLGQFSAVCFLYARSLTDRMAAQNGNGNYVFGLIDSAWGGTKVNIFVKHILCHKVHKLLTRLNRGHHKQLLIHVALSLLLTPITLPAPILTFGMQ